jgi:hypothetical protein
MAEDELDGMPVPPPGILEDCDVVDELEAVSHCSSLEVPGDAGILLDVEVEFQFEA